MILNTIGFACAYQVLRLLKAFWKSLFSKPYSILAGQALLVHGVGGGCWGVVGPERLTKLQDAQGEAQRGPERLTEPQDAQGGPERLTEPQEAQGIRQDSESLQRKMGKTIGK